MNEEQIAAEWCDVGSLKPWGRNPRRNDAAIQRVADSIRRFGFGAPIVARRENKTLIAGHTRLKAAKLLGLKRVPVRFLDVTERDAELLALADNKLGEIAEWDDAAVAKILSEHSFGDAAFAGWSDKELGDMADAIIDGQSAPETTESNRLNDGLTYSLVVECKGESEQAELLERLELEGYSCKPLIS